MSDRPDRNCFIFIVDTDQYAGNFERYMCAYLTGQIGDCEVGKDMKRLFILETKDRYLFDDIIMQVADEHGCNRPVSIWPTPGYGNNVMGKHEKLTEENKETYHWPAYQSVAIFFEKRPSDEMISLMKKRLETFEEVFKQCFLGKHYNAKILGCRLVEYKVIRQENEISI
jgi:hypothetical protein